ncbi:GtrA family protein [Zoogloea sp.]|uniref:GtrA family protein n=1 Tax=Zoogloea sp. TaxID=49181 RepID=UPI0026141061|nr:GtrA family protein [Zoogloea sp.]
MKVQAGWVGLIDSRVIRFLSTGVLNTAFGYLVYVAAVYFGAGYSRALLIATVMGVVFNYFSFNRLVFRGESGLFVFAKFVLAYCFVYAVNVFFLGWLIRESGLNPYYAQGLCVPPSVLLSWVLMNFLVFKK